MLPRTKLPQLQKATHLTLCISSQRSWLNCKKQPISHYVSHVREAGSIEKATNATLFISGQRSWLNCKSNPAHMMYLRTNKLAQFRKQPSSIVCISDQKSWLSYKKKLRSFDVSQIKTNWLNCISNPAP